MLRGLNHITLAVNDLDLSLQFYTSVLGFKPEVKWNRGAYLSLGNLWLCLSCDQCVPRSDYSHIAFDIAQDEFLVFSEKLVAAGVVQWKTNTSEGDSFYFLDPNGHKLEVHVGDLRSRLSSLRLAPYEGAIFF
jgi:catechol 2,3-dioxygenase-like lactoylglutathione lyase family enzyme